MKKWKDLDGSKLTRQEVVQLLDRGFRITMTTGTIYHGKKQHGSANLCNERTRENYSMDFDMANDIIRDEELRYFGNERVTSFGLNINQMRYGRGKHTPESIRQEHLDLVRATLLT